MATFAGGEELRQTTAAAVGVGGRIDGGGDILAIQTYPRTIPADWGGMSAAIVTFQPCFRNQI